MKAGEHCSFCGHKIPSPSVNEVEIDWPKNKVKLPNTGKLDSEYIDGWNDRGAHDKIAYNQSKSQGGGRMDEPQAYLNDDRVLFTEPGDEGYSPKIFVTKENGIGMNVGGLVIVMKIEQWHALAESAKKNAPELQLSSERNLGYAEGYKDLRELNETDPLRKALKEIQDICGKFDGGQLDVQNIYIIAKKALEAEVR